MQRAEGQADGELSDKIVRFIGGSAGDGFEALFLQLFRRHYRLNAPYRVYCDSLGANEASVADWRDVPAVPARAFKTQRLSCAPDSAVTAVFHSSGTTGSAPSRHLLDKTAERLYRASLRRGYADHVPLGLPILALMTGPDASPNSSLSYMLGALGAEAFFANGSDAVFAALALAQSAGEPVCLFGTAFAFVDLFDAGLGRIALPPGSVVVETGGLKGRTREVSRADLYDAIASRLDVRPPLALSEYGMSEMASQYYGTPEDGFSGPPWLRTRVLDPSSGVDSAEGQLVHYDLANWNSAPAIVTQDAGRLLPSGRFELLGRIRNAEIRGCSLTVEQTWTAARPC